MVFALIRSGNDNNQSNEKQPRRNSLAGWLGRKQSNESEPTQEVDTAAGLNRVLRMASPSAESLSSYADPIREALASIESALYAIDSVREVIDQAYEVVLFAQNVEDAGGRALLAESYDELRQQITKIIDELDERAASLLGKNQHNLEVKLGGKAQYSISPTRMDLSSRGLNLEPPRDAFATFDEITAVLGELDSALNKADRAAAGYCRDAQFLIARLAKDSAA